MKYIRALLLCYIAVLSKPVLSAETTLGFDITLNVNELIELLVNRTEMAWGRWNVDRETRAVPELASLYIQVGSLFTSLSTQMYRTVPPELRASLCDEQKLDAAVCEPGSELSYPPLEPSVADSIVRDQFSELKRKFYELRDRYEELGASVVLDDPSLHQDTVSNIGARSIAIEEAYSLWRSSKNDKPKVFQMALRLETLGKRAARLGERFATRASNSRS